MNNTRNFSATISQPPVACTKNVLLALDLVLAHVNSNDSKWHHDLEHN